MPNDILIKRQPLGYEGIAPGRVLRSLNDTTAAICGQIAGAYYGVNAIPASWLAKIALAAEIESLADRLLPAPI